MNNEDILIERSVDVIIDKFIEHVHRQSSVIRSAENISQCLGSMMIDQLKGFREMILNFLFKPDYRYFAVEVITETRRKKDKQDSVKDPVYPRSFVSFSLTLRTTDIGELLSMLVFTKKKNRACIESVDDLGYLSLFCLNFNPDDPKEVREEEYMEFIRSFSPLLGIAGDAGELLSFALNFPERTLDDIVRTVKQLNLPEYIIDDYKSTRIRGRTSTMFPTKAGSPRSQTSYTSEGDSSAKKVKRSLSTFRREDLKGTRNNFDVSLIDINFEMFELHLQEKKEVSNISLLMARHMEILRLIRNLILWRRNLQNCKYELNEYREVQPLLEKFLERILFDLNPLVDSLQKERKFSSLTSVASSPETTSSSISIAAAQKIELRGDLDVFDKSDGTVKPATFKGFTDLMVSIGSFFLFLVEIKTAFAALCHSDSFAPKDQALAELYFMKSQTIFHKKSISEMVKGLLTDLFVVCLAVNVKGFTFMMTRRYYDPREYILTVYFVLYLSLSTPQEQEKLLKEFTIEKGSHIDKDDSEEEEEDKQEEEQQDAKSRDITGERKENALAGNGRMGKGTEGGQGNSNTKTLCHGRNNDQPKQLQDSYLSSFEIEQLNEDIEYAYQLSYRRRNLISLTALRHHNETNKENIVPFNR